MNKVYYIYANCEKGTFNVFYIGSGSGRRRFHFHPKQRSKKWIERYESKGMDSYIIANDIAEDQLANLEDFYIAEFREAGHNLVNAEGKATRPPSGFTRPKQQVDANRQSHIEAWERDKVTGRRKRDTSQQVGKTKVSKSKPKRVIAPVTAIIQCTKTGEFIAEHSSAQAAERATGVPNGNIIMVVNGKPDKNGKVRQSAGGFMWFRKQ